MWLLSALNQNLKGLQSNHSITVVLVVMTQLLSEWVAVLITAVAAAEV